MQLVGEANFRYVYTDNSDEDHKGLNWSGDVPQWCIHISDDSAAEWLENADVLLAGLREFDLFERRAAKGLKNFYMTERWFKPPIGILRLLHPRYFGYARRLCRMMEEGKVIGLPIGIHAARDMARLCGLMHGDFRCLFGAPELEFESRPGGRIFSRVEHVERVDKYCLDKMRMWGYFVASGRSWREELESGGRDRSWREELELESGGRESSSSSELELESGGGDRLTTKRVLWVGRMLKWKRVDTIIRAVGELSTRSTCSSRLILDIFGRGPEELRLKKMAAKYGEAIKFHPPVPIDEVRKLMREHDIYVFASNGYEGWGAVVSEALEEGMHVIGTYEAGSSATMLPDTCLFHSGDWETFKRILQSEIPQCGIGTWTAKEAASVITGTIRE